MLEDERKYLYRGLGMIVSMRLGMVVSMALRGRMVYGRDSLMWGRYILAVMESCSQAWFTD